MKIFFLLVCFGVSSFDIHAQKCDQNKLPIIFVHGFLGSGDTYAGQIQRFLANGYCLDQLVVFDWNSVGARGNLTAQLDSIINLTIKNTGAAKVNLVGHSAGGGVSYSYLNDTIRSNKVAHYVHIGSSKNTKPAGKNGEVPTMNIFSIDDKVAKGGDIPNAINIQQTGNDHYQVATSELSFKSMYAFFNQNAIPSTTIKSEKKPVIAGKACILGENTPLANAVVEVYEMDYTKGERKQSKTVFTGITNDKGEWGPFTGKAKTGYEFVLKPIGGQRTVYYYREAFDASDRHVYLRGLPKTGMAAMLLNVLPAKDEQSVLAIFTSNSAVVSGRDSLLINAQIISTNTITPASKTAIAQFIFDDGDQLSSGKLHPTFNTLPFMNGIDLFLDATNTSPVTVFYNGRTLKLPKRKSNSEGVMVLVLN
jgi:Lipase C-terminal domain/Lipase (class 2)